MLINIIAGTFIVALTVGIHTFGLIGVTHAMSWLVDKFRMQGRRSRVVAMITVVFGIFVVLMVEVFLWAIGYQVVGAFSDFETSLYFSATTFSTLGIGDIVPPAEWRLAAAIEGINGFLLIGWSTAYLVAASTRIGPFRSGEHF
ncbi:MAG: ion channel [Rhizobiaceae bacterium]